MSAPTPDFVLGYRAMMLDGVGRVRIPGGVRKSLREIF